MKCDSCGSNNVEDIDFRDVGGCDETRWSCNDCDNRWWNQDDGDCEPRQPEEKDGYDITPQDFQDTDRHREQV